MKPTAIIFFLPVIVLITFFGFGAGTALAHSSTVAWNISPNDTQVFSNLSVAPVKLGVLDGLTRLASTHAATGAQRRAFVGTVTVTGVDSVTLELQGNEKPQKTITLPPGFEFKTPGEPHAGTFDVKARVVILAKRVDGVWVAFMGLVKPEKPSFVPFTGVVTAVNDGVVTVESPDGDVQTLALPGDLGEVALGEVVTVFKKGSGKVTGLVKADQVRKRLNKFLEAASNEEGDEESSQDTDQRSRRADALARTLENFGARHLEVLNRVGGRVQEAVKRQIEIIKAKVKSDRRNSQAIIERVKKKLRVGHGESEPPGHGDRQPEAKGKPTENVDGEKGNRGRGAEKEDGSGTTSPKRPATPGVPRVDSQGDTEGRDAPEDGKRRGSSGKGKNR